MKGNTSIGSKSKSRIAACFVVILLLSVLLVFALGSCKLFSTEIVIKELSIVVDQGTDGFTTFTETIEAKFTEQDTDWWNFYRIIDDPGVVKKDGAAYTVNDAFYFDGKPIPLAEVPIDLDESGAKETYTAKYTEPTGYYYARPGVGLEIGVILPFFSSGTHTIAYSYSVKGIVKGLADASDFYYQYLSESNTMDVKKLHVTVNFPQAEPELRHWLHTSANAVGVWALSEDKKSVTIEVEDISAGEYVESRLILSQEPYRVFSTDRSTYADVVAAEEDEQQASELRKYRLRLALTIVDYVLAFLAVGLGVFVLFRIKKGNHPIDLPDSPIYYRDIPEGYTGGEVSPLYFYYSNENYIDESISATMLELVRLKYITITPDEGKKSAVITVLKKDDANELRTHQKYVVEMLLAVKPLGTPFTMKELEKYAKAHSGKFMHSIEKYKEAILNKTQRDGDYRKDNPARVKAQNFAITMVVIGVVVVIVSGFTSFIFSIGMTFFGAGLLIGGLIPFFFLRKAKAPLTITGQKEYDKLHALSKFMQEFSSMDEHEIPELTLWEDYMIFATAMGIADKVAEQLEIAYPEFKDFSMRGFDADRFLVLYFFSRSFRGLTGLNFVGNIANIVRSVDFASKAAKAVRMAGKIGGSFGGGSFHGGGGGFHGGGFGGRR